MPKTRFSRITPHHLLPGSRLTPHQPERHHRSTSDCAADLRRRNPGPPFRRSQAYCRQRDPGRGCPRTCTWYHYRRHRPVASLVLPSPPSHLLHDLDFGGYGLNFWPGTPRLSRIWRWFRLTVCCRTTIPADDFRNVNLEHDLSTSEGERVVEVEVVVVALIEPCCTVRVSAQ